MALSRRPSKARRAKVPEGSRNYRRTKDGQEYEYVKRRGGGHTPIPVGPDGYVPVEALRQRNDVRDPKARMLDGMQTARTVRPQQLTPAEALPWWNRPGRSDIVGIDAPSDAQVTWKRKERKPTKAGKRTAEPEPAPEKPKKAIDIIMEDLQKDDTFVQPPQVVNGRWYYPINEELAKRGLESYSWSSYQPGSATESYRRTVDQVYDMAEQAKRTARPALHGEIDALARRFAEDYGKWVNTKNSIDASNVSPMIAGPARYNYKKRDRQTSRMEKHYDEYHRIMAIPDKIRELGRPDRNVSIREEGAVESIEDQIAKAEAEQERMKAANAYWRKHKTLVGCPAIPEKVQEMFTQKMMEGVRMCQDRPYPDY